MQIAAVLATAAWLALPLPVLIAGFIRLRGWRPPNWLRAAAWAGAWIAGFALMLLAEIWENTQRTDRYEGTPLRSAALPS